MSASAFLWRKMNRAPRLFVGFDVRTTSPALAHSLAAGMAATGGDVSLSASAYAFGGVLYSGLSLKIDATAFVTASHLPADWNGIKFYYHDGVGFSEEDNYAIRDIYLHKEFIAFQDKLTWKEAGAIRISDRFDQYQSFLKEKFSLSRPLRVVVDCGNGSASLSAPSALKSCGYDVVPLWCDVDPTFPNRSPEPDEQSLTELSHLVAKQKADFGVGFDADGDRSVIVDNKGRIASPEVVGILTAKHILASKGSRGSPSGKPTVLANVECSSMVEKVLERDFTVKRVRVGHTYLTMEAKRTSAILGMESSGHFVFPEVYFFDDAMLLPLFLGKMLTTGKTVLSEHIDSLPKIYKAKDTINVADNKKFGVIEKLAKTLSNNYSIDTVDGIGIRLPKGRVLIRASNTSPMIRITAEADDSENSKQILEKFSSLVKSAL